MTYLREVEGFEVRVCGELGKWTKVCFKPVGIALNSLPATYSRQSDISTRTSQQTSFWAAHKEQVKCQFSSQCHYSVCFQFFNSAGKPTNMTAGHSCLCHTPPGSLMTCGEFCRRPSMTSVSPCRLCVVISGNALANPLTLQQSKASTLTQSFASILILGAKQSRLFVKSYSHDLVVCAVNV